MSTATHTIDAIHFTAPAPPDRTSAVQQDSQVGVDQAPHADLHLADGCRGRRPYQLPWVPILCVSQVQPMGHHDRRSSAAMFDPTACSLGGFFLVGAVLLAALAVRSGDCRVLDAG